MKPDDREQLFRDGFEAWVSGDMERALSFLSDEVEAGAPDWMNPATYRGHEGFIKWSNAWDEAWESWKQELKEVRAVGDHHVVARIHVRGTGRGSGLELDQELGEVVSVDEDGVADFLEFTLDFERALELAYQREVSN
ncbi:MAG TPA: nuclear transport factor 2 family protein [Solirubrobacterales bacterium]|nr:nuclear transport factor 2 family protein [Solirubrobacterales bacterium]